jgi:hypothetical protein
MDGRLMSALVAGTVAGALALPVLAGTCYEVIDRNSVVIFRDTLSPVDLSAAGAPARDAMRSRDELLRYFEVEHCMVIGRGIVSGGRTLTTDEIVAGWKATEGKSGWGSYAGSYGGAPAGVQQGATPSGVQQAPPPSGGIQK